MLMLTTDAGELASSSFDRVLVVVRNADGLEVGRKESALTPARLPGTVALVNDAAAAEAFLVQVHALDALGRLRLFREALVALPRDGVRALRLPLEGACVGVFPPSAAVAIGASADANVVACAPGESCVEGACLGTAEVSVASLPEFSSTLVASCEPDSEPALCTRNGRTCGAFVAVDACGSLRRVACGTCASERGATTSGLRGAGLDDCGPARKDDCARSVLVPAGSVLRGERSDAPADVSTFRLDAYEVTVGRFRRFVEAWRQGWTPREGQGKHAHLQRGLGARNGQGVPESGWEAAWTRAVGAPSSTAWLPAGPAEPALADWDAVLACTAKAATWTRAAGPGDARPITCLSWYDLHAFCIWDGGFLPTEAEWELVGAGSEDRAYPWGSAPPASDARLANWNCARAGDPSCHSVASVAWAGSFPRGNASLGHADLAGSALEWTLDTYAPTFATPCIDCTNDSSGAYRIARGGSFASKLDTDLKTSTRFPQGPGTRADTTGGRCARAP
jgi:formylglycine-generating enzyme required for sulfatase activity